MSRKQPYNVQPARWKTMLQSNITIPMNQRRYEWGPIEIEKFIYDFFDIFENTEFVEKMGSVIYYTGGTQGKECYDGQQRTITVMLTVMAISVISGDVNFSNSIIHLLTEDLSITEPSSRIQAFIVKYGDVKKIPKIHCIVPEDDEAICEIVNGYQPLINFYEADNVTEEDDSSDTCESYLCKKCGLSISRKGDFEKHVAKQHGYKPVKSHPVYAAYEFICTKIYERGYNTKRLKEFYNFIMNHVEVQVFESDNADYVARLFEWENNRGKPVSSLDIIKNKILATIDNCQKVEIFDRWNKLKSLSSKVYSDFGQRLFTCAIQIYSGMMVRDVKHEHLFGKLTTYQEVLKFFAIVEKLNDIYTQISETRYGRLILKTKRVRVTWEGFGWLILPIFYSRDTIDNRLVHLCAMWVFRHVKTGSRTFNNLGYSNRFIEISNEVLRNPKYDYYPDVLKVLREEKGSDTYVDTMKEKKWKWSTEVKMLLTFLETKKTPDSHFPILTFDLEHILPQSKKNDLRNRSSIDLLGNLTLLEAANSDDCKQRGNRSIKDHVFAIKRENYEKSACHLTREIAKLNQFTEEDILRRNLELYEELNRVTDY